MHKKETVELVAGGTAAGWASKLDRVPPKQDLSRVGPLIASRKGISNLPRPLEPETAA
jgi:hypothetical protein